MYTGAVRPIVEYATTSWATASNANKGKLYKIQNVAFGAIVGAMETTPIKETEKRADLELLELRLTFKVLTQTENIRRLPGPSFQNKLADPTKNGLKRQILNHVARDLRRTHENILYPQINEENLLCSRDWNQEDLRATIFLEVPGLLPAKTTDTNTVDLTLEMLEEKYSQADWIHIYPDGSAEDAVRNGDSGVLSGPQPDKHLATQMLQAESAPISQQKPQHSRKQ